MQAIPTHGTQHCFKGFKSIGSLDNLNKKATDMSSRLLWGNLSFLQSWYRRENNKVCCPWKFCP